MTNKLYYEIDKKKIERARFLESTINGIIPEIYQNLVSISVHVACRGSWRIGYTYSGKYCVTIKFNIGWKDTKKFYIHPTGEDAVKLVNKIKPKLQDELARKQALALYRESGLIPKRIAKAHDNKLLAKYPNRSLDAEYWHEAIKLGIKYIQNHGKCPICGHIGFVLNVFGGVECGEDDCGACWDEIECEWGIPELDIHKETKQNAKIG